MPKLRSKRWYLSSREPYDMVILDSVNGGYNAFHKDMK